MGVIKKSEHNTFGHTPNLNDLVNKIYDPDEIKEFEMNEAIESHPLVERPTSIRSKMAYSALLKLFGNVPTTSANPPVLIKGTLSDATNNIFFIPFPPTSYVSLLYHCTHDKTNCLCMHSIL